MLLRTTVLGLVLTSSIACPALARGLPSGESPANADLFSRATAPGAEDVAARQALERRSDSTGWTAIERGDWTDGRDASTATMSPDWTGQSGFVPDGSATDAWRVSIAPGAHYGADKAFRLPSGVREARFRYRVLIPSGQGARWTEADANVKLPGPAGPVSAANGGYGGSAESPLPHDRRAWSARQFVHRPHGQYQDLAMGLELYGMFTENPGSSDPLDDEYGDTEWYQLGGTSPNGALHLVHGVWAEIEVHVRVNDRGQANGFIRTYVDGVPGYVKEGVEWTTGPDMLEVAQLWFDVYHGGGAKRSSGNLVLFFRGFEYRILG